MEDCGSLNGRFNHQEKVWFFEDTDGEMCVLSEDEDLKDAFTYSEERKSGTLNCSILPLPEYEKYFKEFGTWRTSKLNGYCM